MHEALDFGRNPNPFWIMKTRLIRILSVYVLVLGLWFMSSPAASYVAHAAKAVAENCCIVMDGTTEALRCCGISCSADGDGCCATTVENGRRVKICKTLLD